MMMHRINPLYIGLILFIIFILSIFKLSSAKDDLNVVKTDYKETQRLVVKLIGLKANYANKQSIKKSLLRILKHSSLRSAKIAKKNKRDSIILSSRSMDKQALNFLMGKLLNGVYQINSFKIKKLSKFKVSFEMEIKW
jgi:hypothetical protein